MDNMNVAARAVMTLAVTSQLNVGEINSLKIAIHEHQQCVLIDGIELVRSHGTEVFMTRL